MNWTSLLTTASKIGDKPSKHEDLTFFLGLLQEKGNMFDFRPWPRNHMGISEVNQEDRFHMISPTEMGTECSSAINRYEDVHNPK